MTLARLSNISSALLTGRASTVPSYLFSVRDETLIERPSVWALALLGLSVSHDLLELLGSMLLCLSTQA